MEIQQTSLETDESSKKKFSSLKKELHSLKKKFKQAQEDAENRIKIHQLTNNSKYSANNKEKLIEMSDSTQDISYQQFSQLEKAQRSILDIEHRGNNIAKELNSHTDVMLKVNNNIDNMNEGLTSSDSLIRKMWKRQVKNRVMIAVVGISLLLIFLTIIFMKIGVFSSSINDKSNSKDNVVSNIKENNRTADIDSIVDSSSSKDEIYNKENRVVNTVDDNLSNYENKYNDKSDIDN